MPRVVVVGLDAASPDLLSRWKDDLPNFRRLTKEGTWGVLHSTAPALTFPAWPCMATGTNPAKVGVFGLRYRKDGTYRFSTPNATHWHGPAMWDLASRSGRRVIVFNVPGTYPPSEVKGAMVSGGPAPTHARAAVTYPGALKERLDRLVGAYRIGIEAKFDDASRADQVEAWRQLMESQQVALEYLMETEPWDLVFSVSMALDRICHSFWKYADPDHPDFDKESASRFGDVIRRVYQWEDNRLGRILDRLNPTDLLLVVSDHGSVPSHHNISINRWLIDNGYLTLRRELSPPGRRSMGSLAAIALGAYRRHAWVRDLAGPLRRTRLRDTVTRAHLVTAHAGRIPVEALPIDWGRTVAYDLGNGCLYLNVAGREPEGCVQPGSEYERRREDIRSALAALRHPDTGAFLFHHVLAREHLYHGPFLDQAPDLVAVSSDPRWALGNSVGTNMVERPGVSGIHDPKGLFVAWGQGAMKGQKTEASILDIAPTVLHALDLPVPEDCDGKVRTEWFAPGSPLASRPVRVGEVASDELAAYEWTHEEEAQIQDQLRGLGYLD